MSSKLSIRKSDPSNIHELCQQEAESLASRTIFEATPALETVQAMALLAAYSANCWYLIGHAVRLAQQLCLDKSAPELLNLSQASADNGVELSEDLRSSAKQKGLLEKKARIWNTLSYMEQEVSFGSRRKSVIKNPDIDIRALNRFGRNQNSDAHLLAAIEFLGLRSK